MYGRNPISSTVKLALHSQSAGFIDYMVYNAMNYYNMMCGLCYNKVPYTTHDSAVASVSSGVLSIYDTY